MGDRRVVRRHRLSERMLVDILDVPIERAESLAHQLEHSIPPELLNRIEAKLGFPNTCPYGRPIYRADELGLRDRDAELIADVDVPVRPVDRDPGGLVERVVSGIERRALARAVDDADARAVHPGSDAVFLRQAIVEAELTAVAEVRRQLDLVASVGCRSSVKYSLSKLRLASYK